MRKEFTQKEIETVAKEVLSLIDSQKTGTGATVVALSGDLGAGKTTLTQNIAGLLGVAENVISPTFVLMKQYKIEHIRYKVLVHIDAYRFDHSNELLKLGWNELLSNPKNLVLIEWPERVADIIPVDAIRLTLSHKDEETRSIDIL